MTEQTPSTGTPGTAADTPATRARRTRKPTLDAAAAGAVDLAREAAREVAEDDTVGAHLDVVPEGDRIVTHSFECLLPGYRGWRWSVTVTRASRARNVTVNEVCLLPGDDALASPAWLPWSERIAPGDVGPQDVLPRKENDPLLDQGFEVTGDDGDELAWFELGLGRERVLNQLGRAEAAERWYSGSRGPRSEIAEHAKAPCSTCGFFLPVAGSLRQVFGVCASEWSPEDGRVVSADHGCGAHSETDVEVDAEVPGPLVVDDLSADGLDVVVLADLPGEPTAADVPVEVDVVEAVEAVDGDATVPDVDVDPADDLPDDLLDDGEDTDEDTGGDDEGDDEDDDRLVEVVR